MEASFPRPQRFRIHEMAALCSIGIKAVRFHGEVPLFVRQRAERVFGA